MMPRVLVISTYYYPVVGGVEVHGRQLVQYLHRRGFTVEVVTKRIGADDPAESRIDDVPVHRIGPAGERRSGGKWAMLPALASALVSSRDRYDVAICVDYRGIGVATIPIAHALGKPVVAQGEVAGVLAGADANATSGLAAESAATRILKAPARAIYRRADAIVCIGRD